VVINEKNNIIFIHGHTGRYLEPAEGKASVNILEMAKPGLKSELAVAIRRVCTSKHAYTCRDINVRNNTESVLFNVTVKPIMTHTHMGGIIMLTFNEIAAGAIDIENDPHSFSHEKLIPESHHEKLKEELVYTKESLQTTIEELVTSNEELKSINEELQSTNEEMETSKEELQSLNEESITVNVELQSRIEELSAANDDMKNLLDSTDIATIFLDSRLCVRRFTPKATTIIPLIGVDTGRPIKHFSCNLIAVDVALSAQAVLDDLVINEQEVSSVDQHVFKMRVGPYRTVANVIDGVVITFEDITLLKKIQMALSESSSLFQALAKIVQTGVFHIDAKGKCIFVNENWCRITGIDQDAAQSAVTMPGVYLGERGKLEKIVTGTDNRDLTLNKCYQIKRATGEIRWVQSQAVEVTDQEGRPAGYVGTLAEISKPVGSV
jgi:two-component system CheB/CheR fusion protein